MCSIVDPFSLSVSGSLLDYISSGLSYSDESVRSSVLFILALLYRSDARTLMTESVHSTVSSELLSILMQAQHHDLLLNALGITSIRLSVCMSLCLSVSVRLSVSLSVCLCIIGAPQHPDAGSASRPPAQRSRYHQHLSVCLSHPVCLCLSVCLPVCLSVSSELLSILMQAQHHDLLLNALGITSIRLYLSVCLSLYLSVSLSLPVCLSLYHQNC